MKPKSLSWLSNAKVIVLAAFVAALAFGGYLGYLAYVNDSFPSQQKPFGDYAEVTAVQFNGTEYAVTVTWLSDDYLPQYVQLTSSVSDAANSPVCSLSLTAVSAGQSIFMPFGFDGPSAAPASVTLSIAVQSKAGLDFTIQQQIGNYTAFVGDIIPSNLSCTEPSSVM